jgi:hypothetical protein
MKSIEDIEELKVEFVLEIDVHRMKISFIFDAKITLTLAISFNQLSKFFLLYQNSIFQ